MSAYRQTYTIRWSDCDPNGHMANTAYSAYATETRIAYLAAHGWTYASFQTARFGPVIMREEIDYLRELFMGDEITVDFTTLGLSPDESRFKLGHDFVRKDGKRVARVELVGGWMDLTRRKLAPPPAELAAIMRALPHGDDWTVLPDAGQAGRPAKPG
jgi:acyl-CoA thioester hydrolase